MSRRRTVEPFLWLLFSAGGVLAALFIPVLVFLFGIAFPLDLITPPSHQHVLAVVSHPLTVLVTLGLCVLALFHWAHRFRYTLYDGLQLKQLDRLIAIGCYGGAVVGSFASAYVLWTIAVS